jgi:hypothetical protein
VLTQKKIDNAVKGFLKLENVKNVQDLMQEVTT